MKQGIVKNGQIDMKRKGKRYRKSAELVNKDKNYAVNDALELLMQLPAVKFDETVNLCFHLNVNPKHADQLVRGTVVLPHGTGKQVKVIAFAEGEQAKAAQEAGADYVGYKDLIEKIQGGWTDFDVVIASPDTMRELGKLGRVLGPKGLMPSPKAGTVTPQIGKAVKEVKAGRIEFKVDKSGNLHMVAGKKSFGREKLIDNVSSAIGAVVQARPPVLKGSYLKNVVVSLSMSPGIKLDVTKIEK